MATQSKLPWRDFPGAMSISCPTCGAGLELALEHLPDGPVVAALSERRGRGRDDYPVEAMWRALVAGVVFQHASVESLLRELRRNPGGAAGPVRLRPAAAAGSAEAVGRAVVRSGGAVVVSLPSP